MQVHFSSHQNDGAIIEIIPLLIIDFTVCFTSKHYDLPRRTLRSIVRRLYPV